MRSGSANLQPWDIAAGILIVREAGGVVSDMEGRIPCWIAATSWRRMTPCTGLYWTCCAGSPEVSLHKEIPNRGGASISSVCGPTIRGNGIRLWARYGRRRGSYTARRTACRARSRRRVPPMSYPCPCAAAASAPANLRSPLICAKYCTVSSVDQRAPSRRCRARWCRHCTD
jgi:hypothetical protein